MDAVAIEEGVRAERVIARIRFNDAEEYLPARDKRAGMSLTAARGR